MSKKPLTFTCPACRELFELSPRMAEAESRDVIHALLNLGSKALRVWNYLNAFRSKPTRDLTASRRLALLKECAAMFAAKRFQFERAVYVVSDAQILEGMAEVVNAGKSGLTSHNYLKKVLMTIIERDRKEGGRKAEEDLKEREVEQRASGQRPEERPPAPSPEDDDETREAATEALAAIKALGESKGM